MDYKKIDNIVIEGLSSDHDQADAFIVSADYNGSPLKEKEIDELNQDSDFVYQCAIDKLY